MITRNAIKQSLGLNDYGGAVPLLRHLGAATMARLGGYRQLEHIDWHRVKRLVFVCKGNICRSPYAEAGSKRMGIPAVSFGLQAKQYSNADSSAIHNAAVRDLDLTGHRSRLFEPRSLNDSDLVVCFEPWHVRDLQQMTGNPGNFQVTLLGLWSNPSRPYLCDPHGRSDQYFQVCFSLIDSALQNFNQLATGLQIEK
jgi:protein-tyrosine phosphatase